MAPQGQTEVISGKVYQHILSIRDIEMTRIVDMRAERDKDTFNHI